MSFLHSIEFYIIMAVVAAAIVAIASRPQSAGAVTEHLLRGDLLPFQKSDEGDMPELTTQCAASGRVILVRRGLQDVTASGAVSLAVTAKGYDLTIRERISPGSPMDDPVASAMFILDFLAPGEYYHIHYICDRSARTASYTFHTRPGIQSTHPLSL